MGKRHRRVLVKPNRHALIEQHQRIVGRQILRNSSKPPSGQQNDQNSDGQVQPCVTLRRKTVLQKLSLFLEPLVAHSPIQLAAEDKLAALRRIDKGRPWNSLDDRVYCTICKSVISGRQIEVVGGTNGLRALHLKCSTADCLSTPADWILPVKSDTVREMDILFRDDGA